MKGRRCYVVVVWGAFDLVSMGPDSDDAHLQYRAQLHAGIVNEKHGKGVATIRNWSGCAACGVMMDTTLMDAKHCDDCAQKMGFILVA